MSLSYLFPLPTASPLAFANHIQTSQHPQLILHADATRARVRDVLKLAKNARRPDPAQVLHALEAYLPYLYSIVHGIASNQLTESLPVTAAWRPAVRPALHSALHSALHAPKLRVPGLAYEVGMATLTYALALVWAAEAALADDTPLPNIDLYGAGPSTTITTTTTTTTTPSKWKRVSACLLKADAVFRYLLEKDYAASCSVPVPDLATPTLGALITLMAGSIHLATIYKVLQEQQGQQTSVSLYSRVALYAAEQFNAAYQMFAETSSSSSSGRRRQLQSLKQQLGSTRAPSAPLLAWLDAAQKYSTAAAQLFMARASHSKNETGLAVGYLISASRSAAAANTSGGDRRRTGTERAFCEHAGGQQLQAAIDALLVEYRAENDRIAFQKVPQETDDVMRQWPSGRAIVQSQTAWHPPPSLLLVHGEDDEYFSNTAGAASQTSGPKYDMVGYY